MQNNTYENFPWWMVVVSNAVTLTIYAAGLYLMSRVGTAWGLLYALYCVWLEWRVLSGSCRTCYYYGKRCAFGKGLLCSRIMAGRSKGSFTPKHITWLDIVPDFLVSLVPALTGIVLLIRNFNLLNLIAVALIAFLGSVGTGLVRSRLACKYCRQRELGCPAEQLFAKTKQA